MRWMIFILAAAFAAGGGCSSNQPRGASKAEAFLITIGSGGGFTGMSNGYVIHSSGAVERWSRLAAGKDSIQSAGAITEEEAVRLKMIADSLDFFQIPRGAPGNMTSFVEMVNDSSRHAVQWSGMYDDAPPGVFSRVQAIRRTVERFEPGER